MQGNVAIESLIILNNMTQFVDMWEKKIEDDVIWPEWRKKIQSYTPFVVYDKKKFENIVKEKLKENAKA